MRWVYIVAALLTAEPALAADCSDAQTQADMDSCAASDEAQADAALNRTYATLIKSLDASTVPSLKAAELTWIKYRDTECKFEGAQYKGGSIQPTIVSECLADLTRAQTIRLTNQIPK